MKHQITIRIEVDSRLMSADVSPEEAVKFAMDEFMIDCLDSFYNDKDEEEADLFAYTIEIC